jgi:hypothetical protein
MSKISFLRVVSLAESYTLVRLNVEENQEKK